MRECPQCKSNRVHRSRSRTRWERWRKQITGKATYRCVDCDWRGWALDTGSSVVAATAADAVAEPLNLKDSPLARIERRDIRLEELDRIE
jgi:hypothetical protein